MPPSLGLRMGDYPVELTEECTRSTRGKQRACSGAVVATIKVLLEWPGCILPMKVHFETADPCRQ